MTLFISVSFVFSAFCEFSTVLRDGGASCNPVSLKDMVLGCNVDGPEGYPQTVPLVLALPIIKLVTNHRAGNLARAIYS